MIRFHNILFFILLVFNSKAQLNSELLKHKLDSVVISFHANEPGGSLYIEQGNQTLYAKSFGLADLKTKEKFTDFTVTNIGGISKTFIAYGILILKSQGKLNIEDSIIAYFPDFNNKEIANKVKIKHLMMHTSGLLDFPLQKKDSLASLKWNDEQNFEPVKMRNKLAFEPGSNYAFSEQAFGGLVLIIEKVSKMKWQDFIQQTIFTPSGMTFSKLTTKEFAESGIAHGYLKLNKKFIEYDKGECPKMATAVNAGVWSSVVDLRKYMNAIKYCLFLNCEGISQSKKTVVPTNWKLGELPKHGMCWFLNETKANKKNVTMEYSGRVGGYSSYIKYFEEEDITIILLSNNLEKYNKIVAQLSKFNL